MTTKRLIYWIIGIIILMIGVGVVLALMLGGKSAEPGTPQQPVTLPVSGTATSSLQIPDGSAGTMTITDFEGGSLVTNDFVNNGTTIPDAANQGRYLLAGDLGYCLTNEAACKAGGITDFNIFYDSADQSFAVALLVEPIGRTRLVMETFLARTLGVSQPDMCRLNYYIGVTSDINSFFAGKNLGFSFCQGATKLPE